MPRLRPRLALRPPRVFAPTCVGNTHLCSTFYLQEYELGLAGDSPEAGAAATGLASGHPAAGAVSRKRPRQEEEASMAHVAGGRSPAVLLAQMLEGLSLSCVTVGMPVPLRLGFTTFWVCAEGVWSADGVAIPEGLVSKTTRHEALAPIFSGPEDTHGNPLAAATAESKGHNTGGRAGEACGGGDVVDNQKTCDEEPVARQRIHPSRPPPSGNP